MTEENVPCPAENKHTRIFSKIKGQFFVIINELIVGVGQKLITDRQPRGLVFFKG